MDSAMFEWFIDFGFFILMFGGMALGVVFANKPISGSCGGLGNKCAACNKPCAKKAKSI